MCRISPIVDKANYTVVPSQEKNYIKATDFIFSIKTINQFKFNFRRIVYKLYRPTLSALNHKIFSCILSFTLQAKYALFSVTVVLW